MLECVMELLLQLCDALQVVLDGIFVVVLEHAQLVLNLVDQCRGAGKLARIREQHVHVLRVLHVVERHTRADDVISRACGGALDVEMHFGAD